MLLKPRRSHGSGSVEGVDFAEVVEDGVAVFRASFDFKQVFRSVTYAQSPAVFQIVPVLQVIFPLWTLVTTTAAIQDVSSKDTKTAAILTILGAGGGGLVLLAGVVARLIF